MTRTSASPYEIGHAHGVCAQTNQPLAPGDRFVAVVAENPDGSLARADYSLAAWEGGARPSGQVFAAWRTTVPQPGDRPKPLVDDDELMDMFEREVPEDDGSRLAFRYLVALVLIRKRRLVYEGGRPADAKRGTRGVMLVRPKVTKASGENPDVIEVIDPGLSDEQAAELAGQLDAIMHSGDQEDTGGNS